MIYHVYWEGVYHRALYRASCYLHPCACYCPYSLEARVYRLCHSSYQYLSTFAYA